ncbi:hypothetical protein FNV43_RR24907 [Rhamnella rubrinervis]|uniref:Uncharacterized protein n=1 Tax=Rhamnella rubrinervis TaxID=2594499 RepID=A0A8K0DTH3_9ROSA|nr:hypothetical protein FNV43_RR24907 [Rhamnella rubrinervis]
MEKDKASKRTRDDRDHRDRSSRDSSDHHRHQHRSDRDSKRERSHEPRDHKSRRERSSEPRGEREGSRDWVKHGEVKYDRSEDHEESVERRHKRKERGGSEDRGADVGEKRVKVSEDGKEINGGHRERRKFEDRRVKEEEGDDEAAQQREELYTSNVSQRATGTVNGDGLVGNGAAMESHIMASRSVPETSLAPSHPLPTKVSSISTPHENKGVSITRSHEVHGKSSTDGTSSTAGKGGNLSLDDLAKLKKTLQVQKELSEKLKKLPVLKKGASSSSDANSNLGPKEVTKPPVFAGMHGLVPSTTTTTAVSGATLNSSTLIDASSSPVKPSVSGMTAPAGHQPIPNIEAVKRAQELAARMGFRQDPEFAPLINLFPGQTTTDVAVPQKPTKAPVLRLDALGREIDEHGNLVNLTKPNNLSTLKVNINKQKKDAFQILRPDLEVDPELNPHFDLGMGINKNKLLRPRRMNFQFVEEGKWSKEAEHIKLKSKFGEAQAKEQRAKQAQLAKAKAAPDINPNLIEVSERVITKEKPKDPIPEVEWWDVSLLHSGMYGDIVDGMIPEDRIKLEKITIYVQHPRPIEPPAESAPPPPQPLKLTKKERKKLRTQQRLAKEKDKQEMLRQGLIEPPKPKVKMSNLMKVLGSEATQDPTKLEKEIRSAAAEREQAHIDRNMARKLTPGERREKKDRKLFDDPNTLETIVSVYKINDLSHPKSRFKVDMFAREYRLTGCAVISDGMTVVVVEGGSKTIKKYGKVMLRRINWANTIKEDEEDEDGSEDKPVNKCVLVWQGSVAKPAFNRFLIHDCMTEAAARKILSDAGVVHYWDIAVNFSEDQV